MNGKSVRQSNIELLRIVAAIGVVLLHYNNPLIGGGFKYVAGGSINEFILTVLETAAIPAVNLFVLISGYFLCRSSKRDGFKIVKLLMQYFIFGILFYLAIELPKGQGFSLDSFLSYFTGAFWFIFVYAALYMISPYLNIIWDSLLQDGRKRLLIISLGLFSVYPMMVDIAESVSGRSMGGLSTIGIEGSQSGYTIVNFVLMYFLGCCLQTSKRKYRAGKILILLIVNMAALIIWSYVDHIFLGKSLIGSVSIKYENPLVISEAVLIFLLFKNIKMPDSRIINTLSSTALTTYLLHVRFLPLFHVEEFVTKSPLMLIVHALFTGVLIYLICFVLGKTYDFIMQPFFTVLDKIWQKNRNLIL